MGQATSSLILIQRIKRGEREAFSPLFEKYRSRLGIWIGYRLGEGVRQHMEVDDVVQETFLRAFQEFNRFTYESPGSFFRWLSAIAEHVIIDKARYYGREKRKAEEVLRLRSPSNPGGPEPVDSSTPSRRLSKREDIEQLLRSLDALPEDYRQAILLAKVEGLTTQELAERIGKSREAAALLLHRALKRLREIRAHSSSS